jgi:hypothetical protein
MELGLVPRFKLLEVGVEKEELWRRYVLEIEGFECKILEVFLDREMFRRGVKWLDEPELDLYWISKGLLIAVLVVCFVLVACM